MIGLFILQWILNVGWNPIFFYFHHVTAGLVVISILTILVGYLLFSYWPVLEDGSPNFCYHIFFGF
ncbi:MAG: tryptophan-rich sensory protein [Saprospiraceae bacterium]|nr:tryptophan-rich sensory protein [Saprospiraceae bacterium]